MGPFRMEPIKMTSCMQCLWGVLSFCAQQQLVEFHCQVIAYCWVYTNHSPFEGHLDWFQFVGDYEQNHYKHSQEGLGDHCVTWCMCYHYKKPWASLLVLCLFVILDRLCVVKPDFNLRFLLPQPPKYYKCTTRSGFPSTFSLFETGFDCSTGQLNGTLM